MNWTQIKIKLALFLIKFPLNQKKKYVYLTYEPFNEPDGLGSQLQKIMAIYSLSQYAKTSYIHTPLQQVMWHPLDLQESELNCEQLLAKYNSVFKFPSSQFVNFDKVYTCHEISILEFIRITYTSLFKRRLTLISVTRAYSIVDLDPNMYKFVRKGLESWSTQDLRVKNKIILHIRQGVPDRLLSIKYFEDLLSDIFRRFEFGTDFNITILTDLPKTPFTSAVEESQKNLWKAGGFLSDDGSLPVPASQSFYNFTSKYKNVRVIYGGDVLKALYLMASADHLLMSKSSLSFVGAVLNEGGIVYCPSDFYHPPMKHWELIP